MSPDTRSHLRPPNLGPAMWLSLCIIFFCFPELWCLAAIVSCRPGLSPPQGPQAHVAVQRTGAAWRSKCSSDRQQRGCVQGRCLPLSAAPPLSSPIQTPSSWYFAREDKGRSMQLGDWPAEPVVLFFLFFFGQFVFFNFCIRVMEIIPSSFGYPYQVIFSLLN